MDHSQQDPLNSPTSAGKSNESAENPKKRPASAPLLIPAATKLLKLSENSSVKVQSPDHSADVKSKESQNNSIKSLLDFLPPPKAENSKPTVTIVSKEVTKQKIEPSSSKLPKNEEKQESKPTSMFAKKKISLAPAVTYDLSILDNINTGSTQADKPATTVSQAPKKSLAPNVNSAPTLNPSMVSNPVVLTPNIPNTQTNPASQSHSTYTQSPYYTPEQITAYYAAYAGNYSYSHEYDNAYGSSNDGPNIVDVSQSQILQSTSDNKFYSTSSGSYSSDTRARLSTLAKGAKSKNQLTYLAAVAPEVAKKNKEKAAIQATQKSNFR